MTRDEMETRRLLIAQHMENLAQRLSQREIARVAGVSQMTIFRWKRLIQDAGLESLRKRKATGRPPRLSLEQRQEVAELYRKGPRAAGCNSDRWTTAKLAAVIAVRFGVYYNIDHVGRLMHQLGLVTR